MQPNKPVVLVVDDDPVNLDILVQTLEQDYFLIIAKNGKRALDLAFKSASASRRTKKPRASR